jgi:hypothetical protein
MKFLPNHVNLQRKNFERDQVAFGRSPADIAALAGRCNKPILRRLMTWRRRVRMVVSQEQ